MEPFTNADLEATLKKLRESKRPIEHCPKCKQPVYIFLDYDKEIGDQFLSTVCISCLMEK